MKKTFIALLILIPFLTGCGIQTLKTENKNTVKNAKSIEITKKKIVASFYPLAFFAEKIVGDKMDVMNLAGASEPHEYVPSPQEMVQLNKADLVIFQGAELEPWADDTIPELEKKGVKTLEVSHGLNLAKMEESDEDEHEEGHEGHDHEWDPHTWLDPVLAQDMIEAIAQKVETMDPKNKALYAKNAENLKKQFKELDQEFQSGLQNCSRHEVIISHDAFGYLARRYYFTGHAIAGVSPEDEPSAQLLSQLKKEVEESNGGITHVLVEENNVKKFANTLVQETGLKVLTMNPLEEGTGDPKKDFVDVMKETLANLKTSLNCQ